MFNTASRRLTIWYVTCVMALSLAFSVWVYQEATKELELAFDDKVILQLSDSVGQRIIERQLKVSRQRIMLNLVYLNGFVFIASSIGAYFLARRTLEPIEDAVEAQNRFTADASHELRTPLAAMKTELDVALRDPTLSKDEMRELLESNVEEIDRMTALTQDLLALARPQALLHVAIVDADAIATDAVHRMSPLAKANKVTCVLQLGNVTAKADPSALNHIIGILLDNAIKYSPQQTKITVSTVIDGNSALIVVADEGPGIAKNDLPHIFERFYRADSSRSSHYVAGHGLGLSIAHKLASAMRGTINVQNKNNSGAVFTVKLPRG